MVDEEYDVTDKQGARELGRVDGKLEFHNVSFHYNDGGSEVLSNLNFTVRPGETVAFVGMSGGGKSTIVSLIPRFYDATEGTIRMDGHDLKDVTIHSLR
ncbi:ATP-binding cassette domain-containing protein, partial [Streptococcus pneumoniae]|nr:ATP-binding cassette domain-containing protein [Streptococcus pneumoniae]